jgi:hypothetical protein
MPLYYRMMGDLTKSNVTFTMIIQKQFTRLYHEMGRPVDLGATKTNRRWTESLAGQPALGKLNNKKGWRGWEQKQ